MVGTPPVTLTRSRWISSKARTGSHLCMNTSVPPAASAPISAALQAVTWNSGMTSSMTLGVGVAGGTSPRRRIDRSDT